MWLLANGAALAQANSTPPFPLMPAAQQSAPPGPVLRVNVRLIQVNVIAQDGSGKPVTDLTKDDFTIMEAGKPQPVAIFAKQITGSSDATAPAATSAARNFFSNHVQSSLEGANSVTVILLDAVNTSFHDLVFARAQVVAFLRQLHPRDQVALYLLTPSKLYTLHDFTNDSARLVRLMGGRESAANAASASAASTYSTASADPDAARANKLLADALAESNHFQHGGLGLVESTNLALRQIASNVVNIPGRKNLVWISDDFPVSMGSPGSAGTREVHEDFTAAMSVTAKILGDANVAVYPVDAHGLQAPKGGGLFAAPTNDLMLEIARGTGGRAFYNTNSLTGAIRRAVDDASVSYLLGYYPANENWDRKFRGIVVKVARRGVHLRYRTGYYADPEVQPEDVVHSRLIWDAIRSPLQLFNLGLEVQADPQQGAVDRELNVQIRIAPGQMRLEQDGDRWTDTIDVVWVGLSADGRVLSSDHDIIGIRPAQPGYQEIQQKGFTFSEHVAMGNESVEMKLIVRDRGSGAIGSVNIPLARLFANFTPGAAQN